MIQIHEWYIGDDKVKSKIEIDPATQQVRNVFNEKKKHVGSIFK